MLLGLDALDPYELLAPVGDGLGLLLVCHDVELVTGARGSVESEYGYRGRRAGLIDFLSALVEHCLDTSVVASAEQHVSRADGSVLNENRGHISASLVE